MIIAVLLERFTRRPFAPALLLVSQTFLYTARPQIFSV
jgi:hypothetical protein